MAEAVKTKVKSKTSKSTKSRRKEEASSFTDACRSYERAVESPTLEEVPKDAVVLDTSEDGQRCGVVEASAVESVPKAVEVLEITEDGQSCAHVAASVGTKPLEEEIQPSDTGKMLATDSCLADEKEGMEDTSVEEINKSVPELFEDINKSIASVMDIAQALSQGEVAGDVCSASSSSHVLQGSAVDPLDANRMETLNTAPPPYCAIEGNEQMNEFGGTMRNPYQDLRLALNELTDIQEDAFRVSVLAGRDAISNPSAPVFCESATVEETGGSVAGRGHFETYQDMHLVHRKISHRVEPALEDPAVRVFSEAQLKALYQNAELEANDQFIEDFISTNLNPANSEFHELVMGYLRARVHLVSCTKAFEDFKKEYKCQVPLVWGTVEKIAEAKGQCLDKVTLSGTHKYVKCVYNKEHARGLNKVLKNIQSTVHENYALHAYELEMSRLQIESYLHRLLSSVSEACDIPRNSPLQVYESGCRPAELVGEVENIKSCVSVLFAVQRKPLKDAQSLQDTRNWLTNLVAVVLRVGTFEDHLFLLNHVLRLPAGIGSWAAAYIQVPLPPASDGVHCLHGAHLDHILTVLATVLLPVRDREEFMQHLRIDMSVTSTESADEFPWVVVDSEGEEDEDPVNCWLHWRESDVVALLNQIPFAAIFRCLLRIHTKDNVDYYDVHQNTEHDLIRVFAIATRLIHLFREGLKTFYLTRYRQFTKRISQLIRHTVLYVSDHWSQFSLANGGLLPATRQKLQSEYDQFFLRSAYSIFSSQRLGAWQFMAAMPYDCVSVHMLWKILWLLHNDYKDDIEAMEEELSIGEWRNRLSDVHLRLNFEEKLSCMPQSEAYYLLTAFANMACSRDSREYDIIEAICKEVFQISFMNEHTKELCSKWGRELLFNITTKHPFVMSLLVEEVRINMEHLGKISIYLFCELPVHIWEPCDQDVDTIISWLTDFAPCTPENQLAQIILSSMNWDFDGSGSNLFLSIHLHRRILVAVLQSYQKHVQVAKGNLISESFKQVTSLASAALRKDSNPDEAFSIWAWEMAMSLRVHVHQQPAPQLLDGSTDFTVPDLHNNQSVGEILWCFRQKHPFAIFAAFAATNVGHNQLMIQLLLFHKMMITGTSPTNTEGLAIRTIDHVTCFTEKLDYLVSLVELQYYDAALHILCHSVPLFFNCGHYLWTCKRFLTIIQGILSSELTYLKMAKSLVSTTFPGKMLQCFAGVIEHQVQMSSKFGWELKAVLQFWMELLTSFPFWFKDHNVLYLLDSIIQASFVNGLSICQDVLSKKFLIDLQDSVNKNEASSQGASGSFTSFVSWLATGCGVPMTFVPKNICSKFVWFCHSALEMETQNEPAEKIWKNTLRHLAASPSLSPDSALKKAMCATENMVPPPVRHLPIYRWAEFVLEVPFDHPLLPLIWQRFFTLFLCRVPQSCRTSFGDCGSVGERFFSNTYDVPLFKKLKKRLEEMTEYHKQMSSSQEPSTSEDAEVGQDVSSKQLSSQYEHVVLCEKLTRLYRTFYLWLEEPRLHDPSLYLLSLPVEYEPGRLLMIFQNIQDPWLEFVPFEQVRLERKSLKDFWCSRSLQKYRRPGWKQCANRKSVSGNDTGVENLLRRLQSYEEPLPLPCIASPKQVIPELPENCFDSRRALLECVKPHLFTLTSYASVFSVRVANHVALDCSYMELMPQLCRNVEAEVCKQVYCFKQEEDGKKCLGPAHIVLRFHERKVVAAVQNRMEHNRTDWLVILNEALIGPPINICSAAVFIENAISRLLKSSCLSDEQRGSDSVQLRDIGVNLFYHLCSCLDSDSELYPPTRQFLTSCIEILGQELVRKQGDQCDHLLTLILDSPRLVGVLAPHFSPNMAESRTFLQLYDRVVTVHKECGSDLAFVVLSKFDVRSWLAQEAPSLSDREQLVITIGNVLIDLGSEPMQEFKGISELYRQHLCILLLHHFPDMYRDVFVFLFKVVETGNASVDIWYDVINTIINNGVVFRVKISVDSDIDNICAICCTFAQTQELFSLHQIRETLTHMGEMYMAHRMSAKELLLQTLYNKCGLYAKPVMVFMGLLSHAYVASMKRESSGSLSDTDLREIWSVLQGTFSPWILPIKNKDNLWQPWFTGHEPLAVQVVSVFSSCMDYANKTVLTSCNVLVLFLEMYLNELAKPYVADSVLCIWHRVFSRFPWAALWPDSYTIELMAKILHMAMPECNGFLGGIFVQIGWPEVVHHIVQHERLSVVVHTMENLLKLHVYLSLEPNVLQGDDVSKLLESALTYPWELIDARSYDSAMRWFLSKCDPQCVLMDDNHKDSSVLSLLQTAAEFLPGLSNVHADVLQKRACYVDACIHLLCECSAKNKVLLRSRMELFKDVVLFLMRQTEAVLVTGPNKESFFDDSVILLTKILNILNVASVVCLQDIALKALMDWAKAYPRSPIFGAFLHSISCTLASVSHMTLLIETLLDSYFSIEADISIPGAGWSFLESVIKVPQLTEKAFIAECLDGNHFLTLNALAGVLLSSCRSGNEEFLVLTQIVEWLGKTNPVEENEYKLLLIWWRILESVVRIRSVLTTPYVLQLLVSLSVAIGSLGDDKSSQGFWATFGMGKKSPLSLQFRFIARCMNAFILVRLKKLEFASADVGLQGDGQVSINIEKQAQAALSMLEATRNNKQYSEFREYLECSLGYITSESSSLKDGVSLLSYLSRLMYPDEHCLTVLFCG